MKITSKELRRIIKEEFNKLVVKEMAKKSEENPEYRANAFIDSANRAKPYDAVFDVTEADEWDREEDWFEDAQELYMNLGTLHTFNNALQGVGKEPSDDMRNRVREAIAECRQMLVDPNDDYIHEPEALKIYLNLIEEKL